MIKFAVRGKCDISCSEKLESELCLFVRERGAEIEKSNKLILSLENKITKLEEINDSLKSSTNNNNRFNAKQAFSVT